MTLFVAKTFTSHSRKELSWKVECDTLTSEDWDGIVAACHDADLIPQRIKSLVPVMRGGLPFLDAIMRRGDFLWSSSAPRLIVDDVLTTGASMRTHMPQSSDIGLVAFARGPLPPNVRALWRGPGCP